MGSMKVEKFCFIAPHILFSWLTMQMESPPLLSASPNLCPDRMKGISIRHTPNNNSILLRVEEDQRRRVMPGEIGPVFQQSLQGDSVHTPSGGEAHHYLYRVTTKDWTPEMQLSWSLFGRCPKVHFAKYLQNGPLVNLKRHLSNSIHDNFISRVKYFVVTWYTV